VSGDTSVAKVPNTPSDTTSAPTTVHNDATPTVTQGPPPSVATFSNLNKIYALKLEIGDK
jgi:hypothetical protein